MRTWSPISWLLILALLVGCSEIPENNDPVIGIWAQTQAPKETSAKYLEREEWIFNDAYLGRYHLYEGSELQLETDFQWDAHGGVYTIKYPGLNKGADVVKIKQGQEQVMLVDLEGKVVAYRE